MENGICGQGVERMRAGMVMEEEREGRGGEKGRIRLGSGMVEVGAGGGRNKIWGGVKRGRCDERRESMIKILSSVLNESVRHLKTIQFGIY